MRDFASIEMFLSISKFKTNKMTTKTHDDRKSKKWNMNCKSKKCFKEIWQLLVSFIFLYIYSITFVKISSGKANMKRVWESHYFDFWISSSGCSSGVSFNQIRNFMLQTSLAHKLPFQFYWDFQLCDSFLRDAGSKDFGAT